LLHKKHNTDPDSVKTEPASMKQDVVVDLSAVNQFKNRLDRHWSKQEMMYNYKAELTGILSKSYI